MMAMEQQLVNSSSDWPTLPGQTSAVKPRKTWGDRRSSEVSTSCDTSCASDDGASCRSGDETGYTSDEGGSWSMSANARAFVPCAITGDKTRLDAKASVFVPGAKSPVFESWHFPVAVRPPPGLSSEVSAVVQPPPGLRAGLSTKAKAFVPRADQ